MPPRKKLLVAPTHQAVIPSDIILPIDDTDKISNVSQKELRLKEAGLTRRKVYDAIVEGLAATKTISDEDMLTGKIKITHVPDLEKRLKAAEMGAKLFGDMKEFQNTTNINNHTKVIYQWLDAPSATTIATRIE